MKIFRPLQLSFNHQVLEQNRRFYFTASVALGVNLQTGEELLDLHYIKDIFECMGENPIPDIGMPKPNGEFLVSGSFYSPDSEDVTGGEVRVKLGDINKNLYVFGERKWIRGFPSKPEPIKSMGLDWNYSFGGDGFEKNPDGIGYKDGLLPSIENPKHLVSSSSDFPEPVGFSQLSLMAPQRAKYRGTYDNNYLSKYFPGHPEDLDWKYFLCGPSDQWIKGYFSGDEKYTLYNMHPEIPVIEGKFPGLIPRCFLNQIKNEEKQFTELPLNLDTIWFFPEKLLSLLIFRGVVEVEDDEAEEISHILCAYEKSAEGSNTYDYYKKAFERRKSGKDDLLNNLNTSDLIPIGHLCAMELLMDSALSGDNESEFGKNLDAKVESLQTMADEKIEEAINQTEKSLGKIDLPDKAVKEFPDEALKHMDKDGKPDIRELIEKKPDVKPDPDVERLNEKLETILPGITAGDAKKIDMKNFSFDKIDEITEATRELTDKKEADGKELAAKEIEKAKEQINNQISNIDKQIEKVKLSSGSDSKDQLKSLGDAKEEILSTLKAINDIDLSETKKKEVPLPRIDVEEIKLQTAQIDPKIVEANQHVQSMKALGLEDEKTRELEKKLLDMAETTSKQIEEALESAEKDFKEGYIMGAHFMDSGLSPHKITLEEVKENFLKAFSNNEDLSGGDWACIDLSGEDLDGINLCGAFLEQVNFKGASLRGADLSGAILSRANLDGADFTGAKFKESNVGAVHAHGANFTDTDFKSAKLSRGDFTGSNFTNANMEEIESLEIVIDKADFSSANMPMVTFLKTEISGAKFTGGNMDTTVFLQCKISDCDFSCTVMEKSAFIDIRIRNVSFEKADISSGCFVATEPEKTSLENINFNEAILKQTNFQNMGLAESQFREANLENAFFSGADLTDSDFTNAYAKNAQFRKSKLTGAKFNNVNLSEGSLAKAHLVNTSFKGANLFRVDFLRSTIANSDFNDSNLDLTLIQDWRPE